MKEVAREMTVKAGQKCTAIRRAIVPRNRIDAVESSTPESTAKFIKDEAEKWAPIVKASGAQVE